MKRLFLFLFLFTPLAYANPYIEYKNEYELKDWNYYQEKDFLRFGYVSDLPGALYFEIGPMTHGDYAWETGYKFRMNNGWEWKGKIETKDSKTKVETEIRFTF